MAGRIGSQCSCVDHVCDVFYDRPARQTYSVRVITARHISRLYCSLNECSFLYFVFSSKATGQIRPTLPGESGQRQKSRLQGGKYRSIPKF
jgi:hypothetical protein